jgi:DNA-binding transcriptional LysR family regulator
MQFLNDRLLYFLRCAEARTFTDAARSLGLTQPALSHAIHKLEEELGVPLFVRGRKGITLTDWGVFFSEKAKYHGETFEKSIQENRRKSPAIALKVGAVAQFTTDLLMPTLRRLKKEIPLYQVLVQRSFPLVQAVEQGLIDCAFVNWTRVPAGVNAVELYADPTEIAGSAKYFSHIKKVKSLKSLENEPWIHFLKPQYDWTTAFKPSQTGIVVSDTFELRRLVLDGYGISEVERSMFTERERKSLVFAPVKTPHPNVKLYAISNEGLQGEKKAQVALLLSELKNQCQKR